MNKKHKIASIIGARPQFIKHAVLEPELRKYFNHISIHSGQHYDEEMNQIFFDELTIGSPDYHLAHAKDDPSKIIKKIESILMAEKPELVIVYGDTNTTLAGAMAASNQNIPIAHIEAGMRSFNNEMPEEINRIKTDQLATLLFTSSEIAVLNLKNEGITNGVINCGDLMKDLVFMINNKLLIEEGAENINKIYCTIHRPYNTDDAKRLKYVLTSLNHLDKKIVFSLHPRTKKMMHQFDLMPCNYSNIEFIKPQSYLNNLKYISNCNGLITDSGGMQKEAYFLKKRCITIRTETEWTETLSNNWNTLVFENLNEIPIILKKPLGKSNEKLYGNANARKKIIDGINNYLNN